MNAPEKHPSLRRRPLRQPLLPKEFLKGGLEHVPLQPIKLGDGMRVCDEAGVAPFAEEGVGYGLDEGGGLQVCGGGLVRVETSAKGFRG